MEVLLNGITHTLTLIRKLNRPKILLFLENNQFTVLYLHKMEVCVTLNTPLKQTRYIFTFEKTDLQYHFVYTKLAKKESI